MFVSGKAPSRVSGSVRSWLLGLFSWRERVWRGPGVEATKAGKSIPYGLAEARAAAKRAFQAGDRKARKSSGN